MSRLGLAQITIYDHPSDYPDHIVARHWMIKLGGIAPGEAYLCNTVEEARAYVQQVLPGSVCLTRSPGDDPTIIETWT